MQSGHVAREPGRQTWTIKASEGDKATELGQGEVGGVKVSPPLFRSINRLTPCCRAPFTGEGGMLKLFSLVLEVPRHTLQRPVGKPFPSFHREVVRDK